jgi:hypothetical protein
MKKQRMRASKTGGGGAVRPSRKPKIVKKSEIEHEYRKVFLPHQLPYQGIYTEDDSLEQPSALKDVPSITTTSAEA